MRSSYVFVPSLLLIALSGSTASPLQRLAILEMNGPAARAVPIAALAETQLTDALTAKLTGHPGFTLVDRASIDRILTEQTFQNSDRSSSETAVRIGKLLGVGQIVLVNAYDLNYTTNPEKTGKSIRTMATTVVRVNARMVDVETAAILAQPSSDFQESVLVSETSTSQGFQYGAIRIPPKQKSSGGDPNVIRDTEWNKAKEAVTTDLAAKLLAVIASAPGPKTAAPLVAGIVNGSVYINQGTTTGINIGNKFQVMREVSVGLKDPTNDKLIVQKQRVCVLTIVNADETSASGTCQGGLPQRNDFASPMQQ